MSGGCEISGCQRRFLARGMCRMHYERWRHHGDPSRVDSTQGLPLIDRFWLSVDPGPADQCWEWKRHLDKGGYGHIMDAGKIRGAHRVSYELHHGRIPDGMHVRHLCDNPACVNPAHLELGTNAENVADKIIRGRTAAGPAIVRQSTLKLTPELVLAIRADVRRTADVARDYGLSMVHVRNVRSGKAWSWVAESVAS